MKIRLHIITAGIMLAVAHRAEAQLPPMYEQFNMNQLTFNPGYAGSTGVLDANFFFHRNAVNFGKGSPGTESITVHAPLGNDKVGLGAKIYRDNIGVTTTNFFGIDYAYRIHVSDNLTASVGLEASISSYSVDVTELDAYNGGDPSFTQEIESYLKPNAGAGLYLHSDNYYFGVSSVSLFSLAGADDNGNVSDAANQRFDDVFVLYGTAGALVPISTKLTLKPNVLVKIADSLPTQIDAGVNVIWNNTFLVGTSYRTNNSMSFVAEYIYNADNKITRHEAGIGYAFNSAFGDDGLYLAPSHEIFIIYRFDRHNNHFVNPRFF